MRHIHSALLVVAVAVPAARAQTFTDKVTTTPIAIQDGFGAGGRLLGFNGLTYCGPTAFNMAIGYLGVNGYSRLGPTVPTPADLLNRERILSGLAGTTAVGGTNIDGLQTAIDTLLQAKGISLADRSWNIGNRPWVDDLQGVNVAPTVNVLLLGWYNQQGGAFRRVGGHFITLLNQSPNALGTGTITINNPDPSSLVPGADVPANALQTLQMTLWPNTSIDLPGPPFMSPNRPGFLQFDPNQYPGYLGSTAAVLETSIALNINPIVREANYPQHTWTITAANRVLNTNGGTLDVTAPITGSGGIEKAGFGALNLLNTMSLTGSVTVSGGTLSSNQSAGTPFGTGAVRLNNGTLALAPAGSGAAVSLTGATGSGATFSYAGGAVLSLNRGGFTSLTYTVGPGGSAPLVREAAGTLVIAGASGIANLGTQERFIVNGTAPTIINGMVAPSLVGQDNDSNRSGDFLTYGGGFARATYTLSSNVPITSATSSTVYEVNNAQTVPAGQSAAVQSLKVGAFTVGGGAGSSLTIGGQGSPAEAGLILNGGAVNVPSLALGAADVLVYASAANGTIGSTMSGSGRLVKFGPGTLTLGATNSLSGNTIVQSGMLRLAANGATGTGTVTVQPGAILSVAPGNQVAGPVTVINNAILNLDAGSRLNSSLNVLAPTGTVIVNGNATIAAGVGATMIGGVLQAGSTRGITTFEGSTTFSGSSQYIVQLYQDGSGPTNLVTNSIHFENPGVTHFGASGEPVNITVDFANVPDPDSGDPFWNMNHTWIIADANAGWNQMWYSYAFIGYDQGRFSVTNDSSFSTVSLVYTFAPVPEPSSIVLAGVGGLAAWRWRRRRFAFASGDSRVKAD